MRIGSMRKALKSKVEFAFCDAPFQAKGFTNTEAQAAGAGDNVGLSWWDWRDVKEGADNRPSRVAEYTGWEESFDRISAAVTEHEADIILGFSQGATATALYLADATLRQRSKPDPSVRLPKAGIVVSGFLPRDPRFADLLSSARVELPTLFVWGTADKLIPVERSQALMDTFDARSACSFEHDGKHLVPTCSGDFKRYIVEFLEAAMKDEEGSAAAAGLPDVVSALTVS